MIDGQGELLRTEHVYEGKVISLRVEHVRLAGGQTVEREIIEHGRAVAMVPLDDEGHVYLVRQYRASIGRRLLEIPAGRMEGDESPAQCAERELQEEVALFPGQLEHLGTFHPVPGYSDELIHLFLARQLRPSRLPADMDEAISIERMPMAEALTQVDAGRIEDAKTIVGLLRVARLLASGDGSA